VEPVVSARVTVDLAKCVGHGRCYELAPEVFGEDERGHCTVLVDVIPAEHEKAALTAAANCPEDAIRLSKA
jgi:ferredoxin